MLLPEPLDPTSAVVDPAGARNDTCFSTGTPGVVLERHIVELDLAADVRQRRQAGVLLILGRHAADFADAIEARERFADLRADVGELHDRHRHERRERQIHDEVADRHLRPSGSTLPPISIIAIRLNAEHQRRRRADRRDAGHRLRDVPKQAVRAFREHDLFALLRRVGLDDADAAERFGEAAGHLGVDLAALAEERPQSS